MSSDKSYTQEYRKSMVSGPGQTYAVLGHYNSGYYTDVSTKGLLRAASQLNSNEVRVVPSYGGVSYNMNSAASDNSFPGYSSLERAYGNWPYCGYM